MVDVSDLEKIASPSILKRIKEADIDKDGNLSVQELIQLVQSEQRAHADRKLFRNFLIALVVAVLILVAALVGAVYGIVKLTDEVDDSNGVLVSANTGTVMATGKATRLVDLSRLYGGGNSTNDGQGATGRLPDLSLAEQMEVVVVPQADGGFEVHRVASVRSFPADQRAVIVSEDGSVIQVGTAGLVYLKDPIADSLTPRGPGVEDASPGRRLLSDMPTGYGVAPRSTPTAPGGYSSYSSDGYVCVRHCDYKVCGRDAEGPRYCEDNCVETCYSD